MSEIAVHQSANDLAQQMEFVRLVTSGARGQSILPDAYRENPANALIAVGLGQAMGLTPAESLYRIAVIKGKPSASAELIAANVRRAGHKLRVKVQEDPPRATCTIIRADDPDEPITIERDMAWAQRMGLAGEPNYKKQPATMLSYRAISACARLACPEALYGVTYTPDEAASVPSESAAPKVTAADFTQPTQPAEPVEYVQADPEPETGEAPSDAQIKAMFATFAEQGMSDARTTEGRQQRLAYIGDVIGREVESSKELTAAEVSQVLDALKAEAADPNAGAPWGEGEQA